MYEVFKYVESGEIERAEGRAKKLFPTLSVAEIKEIVDTILAAYNRGWSDGFHEARTSK